eukprot:GSChrysophyteH1.ASY1.ANO1.1849.1 assembled CDS
MSNKSASVAEIQLSVRVRPLLSPGSSSSSICVGRDGKVTVQRSEFSYPSHVVMGSDQVVAFDNLASLLIDRVSAGYNCTLMAYGQTGSGKTYTMFGPPGFEHGEIPPNWGLFPRTVLTLMQMKSVQSLHASAVEVYHELVFDLLDNKSPLQVNKFKSVGNKVAAEARMAIVDAKAAKPIRTQGKSGGTSRVTEMNNFVTDVAVFARTIEATRTAKSHLLNDRSSRSHCLVKLHVTCVEDKGHKSLRMPTIMFVDLAGSERVKRTGAGGETLGEAQAINTSLSSLGRVIKALGMRGQHVPYRDSVLTMLLRDSFGGKSCTSVVINVAGEPEHDEESICSLKFGERMSVVRNSPTKVIDSDAENVEVRKCITEITEARARRENTSQLEQKLRRWRSQAENLRAIVGRQQTIKSLWTPPAPIFKRKEAEVKELERQMLLSLALT